MDLLRQDGRVTQFRHSELGNPSPMVSKNSVWRYERGEATPTLEAVERFAKMKGKTVAELLTVEESEESRKKRRFLDDVWDAHQAHFGR